MAGAISPRWLTRLAGAVIAAVPLSCAGAATQTQAPPAQSPAPYERLADGAFENKGIARIERLGRRWVLSILCAGTHTTYLDESTIDLASYQNTFVQTRYRYVDRTIPDPQCVAAPCGPVTEQRIALERVTRVDATPEQAAQIARTCQTAAAAAGADEARRPSRPVWNRHD
jgi:hypothetical protein